MIKLRGIIYFGKIRSERTILYMKLHLLLSNHETYRKLSHQSHHCHGCFCYSNQTNMIINYLVLYQGISISQPIRLMVVKTGIFPACQFHDGTTKTPEFSRAQGFLKSQYGYVSCFHFLFFWRKYKKISDK